MRSAMVVAALTVMASPAAAQKWTPEIEARVSPQFETCSASPDASAGVHPAMMECSGAELDRQDARLNQAYTMVMARLTKARKATLRTEQRAWIRQRDTSCRAVFDDAGGGQASQLEQSGCLLRETIERTMWLERYR